MAYFTVSNGFKDGGFNSRSATIKPFAFDPETSIDYEIGIKSTWFDQKVLVNLDVFRTLVHDYQQSTLLPGGSGFVIGNAGNFREQGVEYDVQAHPIDELTLDASGSYSESLITGGAGALTCDTNYPFAGSPPPSTSGQFANGLNATGGCNFNGLSEPYAPKWHYSFGARWEAAVAELRLQLVRRRQRYGAELGIHGCEPRSALVPGRICAARCQSRIRAGGRRLARQPVGQEPDRQALLTRPSLPQTQAAQISGGGTAAANGFVGWLAVPRTFGIEANYRL